MAGRIAVSSTTLAAGFPGLAYAQLKKHLAPGQSIVECGVQLLEDLDYVHQRLISLLADPLPMAMIGICFRPGPATIEAFRAKGVPVVLIDEEVEGASTVGFDSFAGGYLAGQYLARAGRKSIAVVAGPLHLNGGYNALQRVQGFARAMSEAGLPFRIEDVLEAPRYTRRDGTTAFARILDEKRKVDAVFSAAGDATATGILAKAREHGIQVPEQLAILGYDDSPLAAISEPPLSTIRQSVERVATEALRLATEQTAEILARPKKFLLEPTVVSRRSA